MEVLIKRDEEDSIRTIEITRENESVHGFREDAMQIAQDKLDVTYFELIEELEYLDGNKLICRRP